MPAGPRAGVGRRPVLGGLLLLAAGVASGGCSFGAAGVPAPPDPLVALADAARADALLANAAIVAAPELADRVQPLVDARTEHAAALDAEVARLDPVRASTAPPVPSTAAGAPPGSPPTLPRVQEAVLASARAAGDAALGVPPDRVGLVAAVAACCSAYATVLG